ncbi:hypothetical protein ABY45_16400 [Microbacterium maritypicum]|uniref:hypothetical protein n=1 Tax=Microbacterium maritypicum TaxID=33918 RepID=UPI003D6E3E2D
MARSEADKTVAAVVRSLRDGHDPETELILVRIAARAVGGDGVDGLGDVAGSISLH